MVTWQETLRKFHECWKLHSGALVSGEISNAVNKSKVSTTLTSLYNELLNFSEAMHHPTALKVIKVFSKSTSVSPRINYTKDMGSGLH